MRINLTSGGQRPWPARLMLRLMRWHIGIDPGPPTVLSYRPDFMGRDITRYILRAARPSASWDKGHVEMFSAFISKLNSCSF